MKAFCTALVIFIVLIFSIITLSAMGVARLSEYRDMIPEEGAVLADAAEALSSLSDELMDEPLLLALLFSHGRCDELRNAVARCAAAARVEDEAEYAILRAELLGLLDMLERDLKPGVLDVL